MRDAPRRAERRSCERDRGVVDRRADRREHRRGRGRRRGGGPASGHRRRGERGRPAGAGRAPGEILLGDHDATRWCATRSRPSRSSRSRSRASPSPSPRSGSSTCTPGASGHARRLDSPMVGRERQRRMLEEAFDRPSSERVCYLFTVLGSGRRREVPAGGGVPRRRCRPGAACVQGRCLSYGEGITFWPVAEVDPGAAGHRRPRAGRRGASQGLTALFGDDPEARRARRAGGRADRAGPGRGAPPRRRSGPSAVRSRSWPPSDRSWSCSTTSTGRSRRSSTSSTTSPTGSRDAPDPAALHWPGPSCWTPGRPGAAGSSRPTTILLEPLADEESAGADREPPRHGAASTRRSARRIAEAAEGNPLFVEEMLAMLIDDGLLVRATARLGRRGRPRPTVAGPADDPGAARRPARPARSRRAQRDGTRRGGGQGVPRGAVLRARRPTRCAPASTSQPA